MDFSFCCYANNICIDSYQTKILIKMSDAFIDKFLTIGKLGIGQFLVDNFEIVISELENESSKLHKKILYFVDNQVLISLMDLALNPKLKEQTEVRV